MTTLRTMKEKWAEPFPKTRFADRINNLKGSYIIF